MSARVFLAVSVAVLCLPGPATASERESPEYRKLGNDAFEAFRRGDYRLASEDLEKARLVIDQMGLAQDPVILRVIEAVRLVAENDCERAIRTIGTSGSPNPAVSESVPRGWFKEVSRTCPRIVIRLGAPGATLLLDGESTSVPGEAWEGFLRVGTHLVTATKPGYLPALNVPLAVEKTDAASATVRLILIPAVRRTTGLVLSTVGAAALAAAVVLWGTVAQDRGALGMPSAARTGTQAQALLNSGNQLGLAADALAGVGGAILVSGVTVLSLSF